MITTGGGEEEQDPGDGRQGEIEPHEPLAEGGAAFGGGRAMRGSGRRHLPCITSAQSACSFLSRAGVI